MISKTDMYKLEGLASRHQKLRNVIIHCETRE